MTHSPLLTKTDSFQTELNFPTKLIKLLGYSRTRCLLREIKKQRRSLSKIDPTMDYSHWAGLKISGLSMIAQPLLHITRGELISAVPATAHKLKQCRDLPITTWDGAQIREDGTINHHPKLLQDYIYIVPLGLWAPEWQERLTSTQQDMDYSLVRIMLALSYIKQ